MQMKIHKKKISRADWPRWIAGAYIAGMLGIFPFYYRNKYFDMGESKYLFFRAATMAMLALMLTALACGRITASPKNRTRSRISIMDRAVLIYGGTAIASWILSPFRVHAFIGSDDWYMGLLSQLLFVGIYFCISRFGTDHKWPLWVMGVSGAAVFIIAYMHRFGIDPLGLYAGVPDRYKLTFVGILGQATWYSSYICIVLPVMMGVYMTARWGRTVSGQRERILAGVFIFLGFCTAVTQNSDSVYIGLGLTFIFLLWFALEKIEYWKRYVEIGLLAVTAAKITGILQAIFSERVPRLDKLSFMVTKGKAGWLILALALVIYGITCIAEKRIPKEQWRRFNHLISRIRIVFYGVLAVAAVSLPVFMWLVSTGKISADFVSWLQTGKNSYLMFNEKWGNGRGRTWSYSVRVFCEYPPIMKLFGCGPDAFAFYSAIHHAEEVRAMWGNASLNNAHNEWLTALIDYGVVGAASYISVFATACIRTVRNRKNRPILLAAGAAILAYAGHNFFCYQQAICTPLIFIVMGAAECVIRKSSLREG